MGFLEPAPIIWAREVWNTTAPRDTVVEALRAKAAKYAGTETAVDGSAARGSALGYGVVLLAATLSLVCAPFFSGLAKDGDFRDYAERHHANVDRSTECQRRYPR